ncbi:MAG: Uma2 family endonuclease [Candidatus Riflebacteria bacterium]|nr:Uma2 family endonuclease [Candidatus Riflebacteria bacterium]
MTHPRQAPRAATFTYGDYLTWPEGERWEIIDGEAFDMTAAPALDHQELLAELVTQFRTFLRGKPCRVFPDPDVILPRADEADDQVRTVVRPDLVVVCDPTKMDGKRIRGGPDLAIEILSPSTASHDCLRKRRLYEQAGVREFWLVHPADRIVTVFHLGSDGTYGKPHYHDRESKVAVSVLPGLETDLSLLFPPLETVVRESRREYLARQAAQTQPTPRPRASPRARPRARPRKKAAGRNPKRQA